MPRRRFSLSLFFFSPAETRRCRIGLYDDKDQDRTDAKTFLLSEELSNARLAVGGRRGGKASSNRAGEETHKFHQVRPSVGVPVQPSPAQPEPRE